MEKPAGYVMNRANLESGLHSATIVARSVDVPSIAEDITYTISLIGFDAVEFEGVKPQVSARWSSVDPTLKLIPFEIGRTVSVHVIRQDISIDMHIETAEIPSFGPCGGAS